jgi:hypothetical protein
MQIYINKHIYMHVHIHIRIQTYMIYKYIHIHTYTHIPAESTEASSRSLLTVDRISIV